jgi:putative phosphoribosyl transferase
MSEPAIVDLPALRGRTRVFEDRRHAGEALARMLEEYRGRPAVVAGIPAGGVPVAAPIAEILDLPLDVAVVSKITSPGNTEVGYGAAAFDGTVRLNAPMVDRLGIPEATVRRGIDATLAKVRRRAALFRGGLSLPDFGHRIVILVDDGLASGFTMLVAIEAVRKLQPDEIVVAVPTGHEGSVERVSLASDRVFCANVRGGWSYAVADAYIHWRDVDDEEVVRFLGATSPP